MNEFFRRSARTASQVLGSAWSFLGAVAIVVVWAAVGPLYHYSDTWQLVINTGTTIITFLMVFLIQNTQNRDSRALHLKIDELIYALKEPRSGLVGLEELPDAELERLQAEMQKRAQEAVAEWKKKTQAGAEPVKAKPR
jgi:low affinity Fe/Cu permease